MSIGKKRSPEHDLMHHLFHLTSLPKRTVLQNESEMAASMIRLDKKETNWQVNQRQK